MADPTPPTFLPRNINNTYEAEDTAVSDAQYAAAGVRPLGVSKAEPDVPPCDYCGKNWTGKKSCSKCQSVFYCSVDCQRKHWKSGHKKECDEMKTKSIQVAEKTLEFLACKEEPHKRVFWLDKIGCFGYYKVALNLGLNKAIQELLQDEGDMIERFQSGIFESYTHRVMCDLWRGGRQEGHTSERTFSCIDPIRIKKYVESDPQAFDDWFIGATITFNAHANANARLDEVMFIRGQRNARDVAAAFSLVFTNKSASKAILMPNKEPDDRAKDRVKFIAAKMKPVFKKYFSAPDDCDIVEAQMLHFLAMADIRCQEFGIKGIDMIKLLSLRGRQKSIYTRNGIPFGRAMIAKGKALTQEEGEQVMRGAFRL